MTTLLILLNDRVSDWVAKGEITDRYFNPDDVFDEVHLLLLNDDRPDHDAVRRMAGSARTEVHNLPVSWWLFVLTLGWTPALLRPWTRRALRIARAVHPDVVRCHGVRVDLLTAVRIGAATGVPVVVSIHSNPDTDQLRGRRAGSWMRRLVGWRARHAERYGLRRASLVLPVYEPIVPYLRSLGVTRWEVAYNTVGATVPRKSWAGRGELLRAVNIGRQESGEKDPTPIIEALVGLDDVHLTLVGDGPLHHALIELIGVLGLDHRVAVHRSVPNEAVLELLRTADVFVYCSDVFEVSKATIEAALSGLPIVANDRDGDPAPELLGEHVLLVDGSATSFRHALGRLLDESEREAFGRAALAFAAERWDPSRLELAAAERYRKLVHRQADAASSS